mgnify:CR=1 FL=1
MNLREFRNSLQAMEEQVTLCALGLNLTNAASTSETASWDQRFMVGDNLESLAGGLMFNDYVLLSHSWNGECYVVRKAHQRWENDEEKVESIIQFELYRDTRSRKDRPWNKRGLDGIAETRRFIGANQSIANYTIRVRGLMSKLTAPIVETVSGGYNSMDYPTVRTVSHNARITEGTSINKEGSIGAVYQSMHYLVQVINSPSNEELSSNFSHSSILLKEENYTDWIPELISEGVLRLPNMGQGHCIVGQVDEEPKKIVGDTLIEMIDNCRLNISANSQLHINGSNYKLKRGVYFLKPSDFDIGDLRAYERWLIQYSDTVEFTQIRNKTAYLKKMDDVTGNSAQKSSKSLNTLNSIENGVTPDRGTGRITKM